MQLLEWRRPPRALLILAARRAWPHRTHRRCDERMGWAIAAIYDAVTEGRAIAYREIARRAGVHRDTVAAWVHRWVTDGWLLRLAPSGQALMPGARLPRRHEHDGWYCTTAYAIRWTPALLELLEPERAAVIAQAYELASARRRSPACPRIDQLRRWLRWRGGGHDLIRQAHARERAYQAAQQRAKAEAERRRRARRGHRRGPGTPSARMEPVAKVIGRLQFTTRNSDRGAEPVQYSLSPWEQSSRRELSPIARAHEEPHSTRRYRLQRATDLVGGNTAAARALLTEIERKACQVGDPAPGSVQSQILTLAEVGLHGKRSLAWWVGRYEQLCDWAIETMTAPGGDRRWARPSAVAWAAMYRAPAPEPARTAAGADPGSEAASTETRRRAQLAQVAIERDTIATLQLQPNGSWAPRRRPGDDPPDPGQHIDPASLGYVPRWYRRRSRS